MAKVATAVSSASAGSRGKKKPKLSATTLSILSGIERWKSESRAKAKADPLKRKVKPTEEEQAELEAKSQQDRRNLATRVGAFGNSLDCALRCRLDEHLRPFAANNA
jgi:hypothetical protein